MDHARDDHHRAGTARQDMALNVLGITANILGLITAVESVLRKDLLLFLLTVVAVLCILASWFSRRRTRLALALFAVGCLIVGANVAVVLHRWWTPSDTRSGPSAQAGPQRPPTEPSANSPSADEVTPAASPGQPVGPPKLVDTTVVLPRNAAVDVDRPDQAPVLNHVDGATGKYDFYHDWGQVRADNIQVTNAPNVHPYSGGSLSRAYVTCTSDLTRSPYPSATPGGDFCFKTSEGHVAFATITHTRDDLAFVIHVIVWDGQAE